MNGLSQYVIIFLWVFFFYVLGISHVRHSEGFSYSFKRSVSFVIPQGWGFFTRSPREAVLETYRIPKGDRDMIEVLNKNTSWRNWFGLSRNNRFIGYEMSNLIGHIPREAWHSGVGFIADNIPDTTFSIDVKQPFKTFKRHTDYLLVQHKPIPITWVSQDQEKYRPYLVARVKLY